MVRCFFSGWIVQVERYMDCCCDPGFESCEVVVKGERDLFAKDLQSSGDMGITFLFSLYFVDGIEFECQSRTLALFKTRSGFILFTLSHT